MVKIQLALWFTFPAIECLIFLVTVQGQCHYYYGLIGLLIGLLLSLVFLALVLRILLFAEPLRSPGYAYKTLTSRPAFKPRWRLPALAFRQLIPVATDIRVSPTTTTYIFEAKLAYFRLDSKSFLPTLKPRLTASAPRLDTGSRYSLPGREFHPTILCTPNRRTISYFLSLIFRYSSSKAPV